jgi:hypothetical protein
MYDTFHQLKKSERERREVEGCTYSAVAAGVPPPPPPPEEITDVRQLCYFGWEKALIRGIVIGDELRKESK